MSELKLNTPAKPQQEATGVSLWVFFGALGNCHPVRVPKQGSITIFTIDSDPWILTTFANFEALPPVNPLAIILDPGSRKDLELFKLPGVLKFC